MMKLKFVKGNERINTLVYCTTYILTLGVNSLLLLYNRLLLFIIFNEYVVSGKCEGGSRIDR